MKIVGIICEYNPLHRGHAKQFDRIRSLLGDDTAIVCLMSGNYVQRGAPAIVDKSLRAEAAVRCGADLVLELPVTYALSSAEGFAAGGVRIFGGFCDYLCFGAEAAQGAALIRTAEALLSQDFPPLLRRYLDRGESFPAARQAALEELGLGTDSKVIIPEEAAGVEGSSLYLKAGEKLTLEELLYGLMLQSGNDSAEAVAICVGGTKEAFVAKMNERARQLGCAGTHFANPSGLYDDDHYTTARDLSVIAAYAMKRADFRELVGAQSWKSHETDRSFVNKNKTVFNYEGGNGIKIGFTKKSGRTLVASAQRDGRELIAVVLRDGNWFNDAYALMDYGFKVIEEESKGEI